MLPYISIGNKIIPTYGICMAVGILAAALIAVKRTKKANKDINSLIVIAAFAIGCGLFGAKLLYIITSYGIGRAFNEILAGNLNAITSGGQVFYGGLIAGAAGAFLGAAVAREKVFEYCGILVPCVPIGHLFGRIGCFMAGCCYGVPYDGVFSVTFPAAGVLHGVFPIQLFEALINLGIFFYLIYFAKRNTVKYGVLFSYLMLYAVSRFILEFFRGDLIRGFAVGLSTSQWISIVLFAVSLIYFTVKKIGKKETTTHDTKMT